MKNLIISAIIFLTIYLAINCMNKIKLHNKALNESVLMLEQIEILLSYNNLNTEELFYELSLNNNYNFLTFINDGFKASAIEQSINKIKELNKIDKEILINYFSLLGKSDLNGQLRNCKIFKERLKDNLKKSMNNEVRECKSTGIIILGIGFLLVIYLI
ncbi:MAG: hypothetical protein IJZ16_04505 [Clostridia bacterium]|nr:hypothetical protein [Clostridia bacterium]